MVFLVLQPAASTVGILAKCFFICMVAFVSGFFTDRMRVSLVRLFSPSSEMSIGLKPDFTAQIKLSLLTVT